jgi:hypothetical protein
MYPIQNARLKPSSMESRCAERCITAGQPNCPSGLTAQRTTIGLPASICRTSLVPIHREGFLGEYGEQRAVLPPS